MKKRIACFLAIPLLCCLCAKAVIADLSDSTSDTLAGIRLTLAGSIYNTNTKSWVTVSYGNGTRQDGRMLTLVLDVYK